MTIIYPEKWDTDDEDLQILLEIELNDLLRGGEVCLCFCGPTGQDAASAKACDLRGFGKTLQNHHSEWFGLVVSNLTFLKPAMISKILG